jgi:hypothetical protein
MTTLNGLVGIDFNLAVLVVSTSLSSQRAVLIHQFDDRLGFAQPPARPFQLGSRPFFAPDRRISPALLDIAIVPFRLCSLVKWSSTNPTTPTSSPFMTRVWPKNSNGDYQEEKGSSG